MNVHDPLCNLPPEMTDCPTCALIATVRADERWDRLDRIIEAGRVAAQHDWHNPDTCRHCGPR